MKNEVELVGDDYEPVARKEVPDFDREPDVLLWGDRVFLKTTEHAETDHVTGDTVRRPTTYREVSAHALKD